MDKDGRNSWESPLSTLIFATIQARLSMALASNCTREPLNQRSDLVLVMKPFFCVCEPQSSIDSPHHRPCAMHFYSSELSRDCISPEAWSSCKAVSARCRPFIITAQGDIGQEASALLSNLEDRCRDTKLDARPLLSLTIQGSAARAHLWAAVRNRFHHGRR
jgi:hypothetical protein